MALSRNQKPTRHHTPSLSIVIWSLRGSAMRVFPFLVLVAFSSTLYAQLTTNNGAVGGVAISPEGLLQYRQVAPIAKNPKAAGSLLYVSLPALLFRII